MSPKSTCKRPLSAAPHDPLRKALGSTLSRKKKRGTSRAPRPFIPDRRSLITAAVGVTVEVDERPLPEIKPGDLLVALEGAVARDAKDGTPDLFFTAPIPGWLLLDFAADRRVQADRDRKKLTGAMRPEPDGTWKLAPKSDAVVFDTIANEVAAVTFSWMALEWFASFAVAKYTDSAFTYEHADENGGVTKYTRKTIDKRMPMAVKVTGLLPAVFPNAANLPKELVDDFDALRDLRRRTEHLTSGDRYHADNDKSGPMGLLLVGRTNAPRIVSRILEHFDHPLQDPLASKVAGLAETSLELPRTR